mgnify:FL=1
MPFSKAEQPVPIAKLLEAKRAMPVPKTSAKLAFFGVEGQDVYNISQPFKFKDRLWLAGRVEARGSEISRIVIFHYECDHVSIATDHEYPAMQDPFVVVKDELLYLGGTRIIMDGLGNITDYYTEILCGTDFDNLKPLIKAPDRMKDVRILETDKIHLFSRPQGGEAAFGKIGYRSFAKYQEITPKKIAGAVLLKEHFQDPEWGGANQIIPLKNGYLGVVGHIAAMAYGNIRHYYGMVFCFDPRTMASSPVKIIAERSDFPQGPSKRKDLEDVIFAGGIIRHEDGTASFYAGLSDCEAGVIVIDDPFQECEEGV